MSLDLTAFDFALKEYYTDDMIEKLTLTDHALLALLIKMENFKGDKLPVPVVYGGPQGRSAVFATAQTNQTTTKGIKFELTRARDYAVSAIDGETIDASDDNMGAFIEAQTTEFDCAFDSIAHSCASALYRAGTGSIGVVGSLSTSTLTLATTADVANFEVGMTLTAHATDGGAAIDSGATEVVAGVDRDAGTLTSTSADWTTNLSSLAATNYLAVEGDLNAKIKGLDSWLPATVTATTHFGVNRTADAVRLGGNRYDASSDPIEEGLVTAAAKAANWGARLTHYFVSYDRYADIEHALGSKARYDTARASAEIAFQALVVNGPRGPIKVVPDALCQDAIGWGLDLNTWKLYSLGKCPRFLVRDGAGQTLRQASADGEEFRIGYYAQLGCRAPGWNTRVTLPT